MMSDSAVPPSAFPARLAHAGPVRIADRFQGPPGSGNGGYVCGVLAASLSGAAEVTLRAPPPVDAELRLAHERPGQSALYHGEQCIADARRVDLAPTVQAVPSLAEVIAAQAHFRGRHGHPFPACFSCGTHRQPVEDGLCIFPGRLADGRVAAVWRADASLADDAGNVLQPAVWAAIDCAGYWVHAPDDPALPLPTMLLGRMHGVCWQTPCNGEPLIVLGWSLGSEGRKYRSGTGLFDLHGGCLAHSEQTWIRLRDPEAV